MSSLIHHGMGRPRMGSASSGTAGRGFWPALMQIHLRLVGLSGRARQVRMTPGLTYGPEVVLARVLGAIRGITEAFLYGSYAARRAGFAGDAPVDIDVLIIGNPARAHIEEASLEAERLLGREVNVRIVSEGLWREGVDRFLDSLRSSPLVPLAMGVDGAE